MIENLFLQDIKVLFVLLLYIPVNSYGHGGTGDIKVNTVNLEIFVRVFIFAKPRISEVS